MSTNALNPNHVVAYYGSVPKAAEAGEVSRRAVYKWLDRGAVPENRAYRYQVISGGALKVQVSRRRRPS